MFPSFRHRLGAALDVVVEFSTLGEYGLVEPAAEASAAGGLDVSPPVDRMPGPGMGGAGASAGIAPVRRSVAGGAATLHGVSLRSGPLRPHRGGAPRAERAATPAARRRHQRPAAAAARTRRTRGGAPGPPDQTCVSPLPPS